MKFEENLAFQTEDAPKKRKNTYEKKENNHEKMDRHLDTISTKTNNALKIISPEHHRSSNELINKDCSINIKLFKQSSKEDSGPYGKTSSSNGYSSIQEDKEFIKGRYMYWSSLDKIEDNPKMRKHWDEKGELTIDEMLEKYIKNREESKSVLLEKALTVLLHRCLGEDYFVLRTATYDDFRNGVDNLIINKKTGETICGFDDLNTEFDNKRLDEKSTKIEEITQKGGAQIKYGLSIKNGELKKEALKNLPLFYLSLTNSELNILLKNIPDDLNAPINNEEENIFNKIIQSFNEQAERLLSEGFARGKVAENLKTFQKTSETLK